MRALRDLAGQSICFMIGNGAERAMEAALERDGLEVKRLGFEEDVEMRDAYNVGRCQAIAAEATFLAEVRQDGGVHGLKSRILDEPLAVDPIYLATGIDDARWSAIAIWTLGAFEGGGRSAIGLERGRRTVPVQRPYPARFPRRLAGRCDEGRRHLRRYLAPQPRRWFAAKAATRSECALAPRAAGRADVALDHDAFRSNPT